MRWAQPLDEILGSRAKVRILRALWRAEGEAVSGREIARRTGLSHTAVNAAVRELGDQDVVWPSSDRSGVRFRLNRTHVLVGKGIAPLLALEASNEERLIHHVREAVREAISILVFGSALGEDERADSDLDVLVVVPDGADTDAAEEALAPVAFYAREGKLLDPHVLTQTELARALRDATGFATRAVAHGRLLWGEPIVGGGVRRVAG